MADLGPDSRKYKTTDLTESDTTLEHCYCCGNPAIAVVQAVGFPGMAQIGLCGFCLDGKFEMVNGYLEFVCHFCGLPDIAGMVYYWKAIDIFNDETGSNKHGKQVGRKGTWAKVDWKNETEKLRSEYLDSLYM